MLKGGRVIEVGAVAIENGEITSEFSTLIDAGVSIHYAAFCVHGITKEMLHGNTKPEEAWLMFSQFIGNAPLVSHNAPFDKSFITNEMNLLGLQLKSSWHCTLKLSREKLLNIRSHSLDSVYRYLFGEIPAGVNRHRALDDARMAAQIWIELMDKH